MQASVAVVRRLVHDVKERVVPGEEQLGEVRFIFGVVIPREASSFQCGFAMGGSRPDGGLKARQHAIADHV